MTLITDSTHNMLLKKQNGKLIDYPFKDGRLGDLSIRVFQKYKELSAFPAPPPNPYGLREKDERALALTQFIFDQLEGHERVIIADSFDASKYRISCPNEDGYLSMAVVCPPPNLDWHPDNANATEKLNIYNKSDRLRATMQHFWMVARMIDHGTVVYMLKPDQSLLQQVFVRDSIFVVDDALYISNMFRADRKPEQEKFLGGMRFPDGAIIEGGNKIMGKDCIYLGINHRTNMQAYEELKYRVGTTREVIAIPIKDDVIHLDCIFLPKEANGGTSFAFTYSDMFVEPQKALEQIGKRYSKIIDIPHDEHKVLAANVLKLDADVWLANPEAPTVIAELEKNDVQTDRLYFKDLTDSEGAFRCSYADIVRYLVAYKLETYRS